MARTDKEVSFWSDVEGGIGKYRLILPADGEVALEDEVVIIVK